MAAVARGMFGGSLPWSMVITGGGIAIGIIVLDEILRRRGAAFRVPVLAAAVGIYLPMDVTMPIFLGGTIAWLAERALRRRAPGASDEEIERMARKGVLFAAGLISGEALMGIVIAVPIVLAANADVLALAPALQFGQWLGVLVLLALAYGLYRNATAAQRA
jgi:putative OPT family oligopeptide transporter